MLIQTSRQTPMVNVFALPENVVVMTLAREGTTSGDLWVSLNADYAQQARVPDHREIELPMPGGFKIREFVIPFQDLAGSRGMLGASHGFYFRAESAVRQTTGTYQARLVTFWVTFPPNGGGIVRVGGALTGYDLANPRLNFRAEAPPIGRGDDGLHDEMVVRISDENLITAYMRTHAGGSNDQLDEAARRRAARVANFTLEPIAGGDPAIPVPGVLPSDPVGTGSFEEFERRVAASTARVAEMKERRDPMPRYMRDLGLDE